MIKQTLALHKPGAAYWMKLYSAGAKLRTMLIHAPESSAEVLTVKVDGIGALRKLPGQEVRDVEYSFVLMMDPGEQTFTWTDQIQSPWLPTGTGVLQTTVNGQAVAAATIEIPSGVGDWPDLQELSAGSVASGLTLSFKLELLPEEQIQSFAVGRGSVDV